MRSVGTSNNLISGFSSGLPFHPPLAESVTEAFEKLKANPTLKLVVVPNYIEWPKRSEPWSQGRLNFRLGSPAEVTSALETFKQKFTENQLAPTTQDLEKLLTHVEEILAAMSFEAGPIGLSLVEGSHLPLHIDGIGSGESFTVSFSPDGPGLRFLRPDWSLETARSPDDSLPTFAQRFTDLERVLRAAAPALASFSGKAAAMANIGPIMKSLYRDLENELPADAFAGVEPGHTVVFRAGTKDGLIHSSPLGYAAPRLLVHISPTRNGQA